VVTIEELRLYDNNGEAVTQVQVGEQLSIQITASNNIDRDQSLKDDENGQRMGWNPIAGAQTSNQAMELPVTKYERLFTIIEIKLRLAILYLHL
jgi:hypothetical protein